MKRLPPSTKWFITLTERRRYHTAIQVFKSIHKSASSYLQGVFNYSKDVTGHAIVAVELSICAQQLWEEKFYLCGSILWSSLSSTVAEAASLSSFKKL